MVSLTVASRRVFVTGAGPSAPLQLSARRVQLAADAARLAAAGVARHWQLGGTHPPGTIICDQDSEAAAVRCGSSNLESTEK